MMPATLPAAALADLFGISERRVKQLRSDGVLPGMPGDPYETRECVRAYCAHLRPSSGRTASGGASTLTLNEARLALLAEQTTKLRAENDLQATRVLLASEVQAAIAASCATVRNRLLAIPSEIAPQLFRLKSVAEVHHRVQAAVTDALHGLSSIDLCPATVEEPD
jgi:phage terminase Nu1 subunit (DNA packaging protein)